MKMMAIRARGRPGSGNRLTPAERETLRLARAGMSNRQIAEARGVSINTVRTQVSSVMAKLGVDGRGRLKRTEEQMIGTTNGLRCYFCRKDSGTVTYLVAGRDAYICGECIDRCSQIIAAERAKAG